MKDIIESIGIFIALIFTIILITSPFVLFGNAWGKSQTSKSCDTFAIESDRETKYVEYTYWRYDCLTLTDSGNWISAYNLRDK